MTGLIWFVQIVHYPLFALVPDREQTAYASRHQTRTGWVVAPFMLAELLASLLQLALPLRLPFITRADAIWGLVLLAIIWLSTAFLQVPLHDKLLRGPAEEVVPVLVVTKLVLTNWIRTVAWSLRSLLLLFWLTRTL